MTRQRVRVDSRDAPARTPRPRGPDRPRTAGRRASGLDDSVYKRLLRERIIFLGREVERRDRQRDLRAAAAAGRRGPRQATSASTSTRPAARSRPAWRSTTRCSSSRTTSPRWRWAWPRRWASSCSAPARKGKRYALPHARIMMHQPSGGIGGTASRHQDPGRADAATSRSADGRADRRSTPARPLEQIEADSDRDRWFTAEERQGLRLRRPRRAPAPARSPAAAARP